MYWIAFALAGGSLIVSVTILSVVLAVLRSTRRTERAGGERLEILREQQERLQFMRDERRMLEEELQWRRSMMDGEERLLELNAPSESNGHSETERLPKSRVDLTNALESRLSSMSELRLATFTEELTVLGTLPAST